MEEEHPKKRPLKLDWDVVLGQNDDEEPPSLLIVKTTSPKPSLTPTMIDDQSLREDLTVVSDRELNERIKRQKANIVKLGKSLPDKGAKLVANLKALEEELERRKLRRTEIDVDRFYKPAQSACANEDGLIQQSKLPQGDSQSQFASILIKKMEEKPDCRTTNAFDDELSALGRHSHQTPTTSLQKRRQEAQSSVRRYPFRSASSLSYNGGKRDYCNGGRKAKPSSPHTLGDKGKNLSLDCFDKKDGCQVVCSSNAKLKKGPTVVLVDEEETEVVGTSEPADQLDECLKEFKIYYPSRDDPDSAFICYSDIKCLDPEGFLTSPIMNFYIREIACTERLKTTGFMLTSLSSSIRYLRMKASPTNRAIKDCHFFNTFFYWKLKETVSCRGNDKKSYFLKLRRWWRGVNIFEKAYVLIPIHEDLHWSLAIICFPDKEEESGPAILHLDSLRYHLSGSVFKSIKSFLTEEWNYVNNEIPPTDLPISDRIWKNLPRRIDEKVIAVPQQKNDYDCGLFVLYFMERFIKEAPERLRKRDLAMFGKQWFRPEEASGLRVKIRSLLMDEFRKAIRNKTAESSSGT